ncbi:MAG: lamin tail domain-containing protein [Eubacteriales bacterium]|nr:lamin tail domain-containing protein [Eubacteriales bacterium]
MKHRALALLAAVVFLAGCTAQPSAPTPAPVTDGSAFSLSMINIGKGDCLLLQSGSAAYLVDTGKEEDFPIILRALRQAGVAGLNGIFLTHGHSDHIGSLDALCAVFAPDTLYYSAVDTVTGVDKAASAAAQTCGAQTRALQSGDEISLAADARLSVLAPQSADETTENNNSLVLRVVFGQTTFLLMGDAETVEENQLIDSAAQLNADVLKVGHHGKEDASSTRLLLAVGARYACVTGSHAEDAESAAPGVLARLASAGAEVTVSQGDFLRMEYQSDGKSVTARRIAAQDPAAAAGVAISGLDVSAECVTLTNNTAKAIDLSGWVLWSRKGGEAFVFPQGTRLAGGGSVTITSGKGAAAGDYLWTQAKIWKKKGDAAVLLDPAGVTVSALNGPS